MREWVKLLVWVVFEQIWTKGASYICLVWFQESHMLSFGCRPTTKLNICYSWNHAKQIYDAPFVYLHPGLRAWVQIHKTDSDVCEYISRRMQVTSCVIKTIKESASPCDSSRSFICMYVCVCVFVCIYIHINIYIYIYIYTYIYI